MQHINIRPQLHALNTFWSIFYVILHTFSQSAENETKLFLSIHLRHLSSKNAKTFSNLRICYLFISISISIYFLCFELLVGQNKLFTDIALPLFNVY